MHTTSPTLLQRVRDPGDQGAWSRFVELYTPLLFYWARRRGLQAGDAADLVQEVLTNLVRTLPEFEYRPQQSFRNWLRTMTHRKFIDRVRKRRESAAGGDGDGPDEPVAPDDDCFEEREYRQYLYGRALEIVRRDYSENAWQACRLSITSDRSAADIAAELGMTEGAVYAAKCRILKRLREELAGLEE
jgi:RNA polymerase sigma-70 factor (ECF subfamily)